MDNPAKTKSLIYIKIIGYKNIFINKYNVCIEIGEILNGELNQSRLQFNDRKNRKFNRKIILIFWAQKSFIIH